MLAAEPWPRRNPLFLVPWRCFVYDEFDHGWYLRPMCVYVCVCMFVCVCGVIFEELDYGRYLGPMCVYVCVYVCMCMYACVVLYLKNWTMGGI